MANTVLAMQEATTRWLETNPVMPMTSPRILSWALKIKCCGSMTPQKELSQKMGQFLKRPHRHLGKRAWHWMGMFTLKWKHWTHISVMVIQQAVLSDILFQLSECISSERSGHLFCSWWDLIIQPLSPDWSSGVSLKSLKKQDICMCVKKSQEKRQVL